MSGFQKYNANNYEFWLARGVANRNAVGIPFKVRGLKYDKY